MSKLKSRVFWIVLALMTPMLTLDSKATPAEPGPDYVQKYGCQHCHIIAGQGGFVAPPLDGIKDHKDKNYIVQRLINAKKTLPRSSYPVPEELMSHVHVSKVEAGFIADYLMSLSGKDLTVGGHGKLADEAPPGSQFVPLAKSASTDRGMKLYKEKGCMACHAIGHAGGQLAPNLAGVGARRSRQFISTRIAEGAILLPKPDQPTGQYSMPPSKLSAQELNDLTNFLLTLAPDAKR